MSLMTLLLWPVVALPFALLFTWLLSLRAEVYLTSGAVWARLSPLWRERTARGLHVYASFLLPVLLFTLWDTATGPATHDAELAA
ncbi:hypothetical protein CTI14_51495, partial [Methylobacterium radiotolerans]